MAASLGERTSTDDAVSGGVEASTVAVTGLKPRATEGYEKTPMGGAATKPGNASFDVVEWGVEMRCSWQVIPCIGGVCWQTGQEDHDPQGTRGETCEHDRFGVRAKARQHNGNRIVRKFSKSISR